MFSVDCLWKSWSDWSSCSRTCDAGLQYRTRSKNTVEGAGGICKGSKNDQKYCKLKSCPGSVWGSLYVKGTLCKMASGEPASRCHEVDKPCNVGCGMSDVRYKCTSKSNETESYVLWDCGTAIGNLDACVEHFTSGSHSCDLCCIHKNCESGYGRLDMPRCFT